MEMPVDIAADCFVFRDKLLLPSEGFILNHYTAFDTLRPVYLANQFGWRATELSGRQIVTAPSVLARFAFKQFGTGIDPARFCDVAGRSPGVMHAHFGRGGALALPLARALNIPLFVTFHGGDATKQTHQRRRLVPSIYQRRLAQMHDYVGAYLCVSGFVADRLRAQGFPEAKLRNHYIGIPLTKIEAPTARAADAPLLFVGRFVEKKGIDTVLKAMRLVDASNPAIRLEIAGSGPLERKLRAQAAGLPAVKFLDGKRRTSLPRVLQCAARWSSPVSRRPMVIARGCRQWCWKRFVLVCRWWQHAMPAFPKSLLIMRLACWLMSAIRPPLPRQFCGIMPWVMRHRGWSALAKNSSEPILMRRSNHAACSRSFLKLYRWKSPGIRAAHMLF